MHRGEQKSTRPINTDTSLYRFEHFLPNKNVIVAISSKNYDFISVKFVSNLNITTLLCSIEVMFFI